MPTNLSEVIAELRRRRAKVIELRPARHCGDGRYEAAVESLERGLWQHVDALLSAAEQRGCEEPISEEWLQEIGWNTGHYEGHSGDEWFGRFEFRDTWKLIYYHSDHKLLIGDGNPDGGIEWPVPITTRAALLSLLKALGIEVDTGRSECDAH